MYSCPNCKSSTVKIFCDRVSARRVKQLRLSCENQVVGCDWSGILDDYEQHIKECGFMVVDCPNEGCEDKVARNVLEKHCTETCRRRLVDCACCKGKVPFDDLPTHPEVCPDIEITCDSSGCLAKFHRRKLAQHMEVCKKAIINCPFSELGCDVVVLRCDLQKHLREYYEKHALMSTQTVQSLISELTAAKRELNSKRVPPLVFKMTDYNDLKGSIRKFGTWESPYFYSHPGGYAMNMHVVPCGENLIDYSLSLYVHLVPGLYDDELLWPFDGEVRVSILNQAEDDRHYSKVIDWSGSGESATKRPRCKPNTGRGKKKFISHERLEAVSDACRYVKDDCIYFKVCSVQVRSTQKPCSWL